MKGLVEAARYLTIVPVGGRGGEGPAILGRAAGWFSIIGLGIGAVLVLVDRTASWLFPPLLSALLTVTVWKLLTGGLHLDGLADCLDGLGGHDAEQRLAIMRDSRIGTFGALGLILFLLLEIAALGELAPGARWRALLVAPAVARAMPGLLGGFFPPARPGGHGALFGASVRRASVLLALGISAVVALATLGATGLIAVAVACLAATALAWFLATRLGGVTGDVLGAAVEISELAVLLTVAAWTRPR